MKIFDIFFNVLFDGEEGELDVFYNDLFDWREEGELGIKGND